ncbi:hypothetical protein GI374_17625 [Paracoccus sp. S-4012]|uniref:hypothetical protein n=1 Tax=Paracoccus sp. S-4012 TaxID=2665648 RepID=UPI0012AFBE9E|nr:hypothetical protein [Paracoccus sp. S-4012]MRX52185.1 hypothetical protein [Paracoccus sp. S-4012]
MNDFIRLFRRTSRREGRKGKSEAGIDSVQGEAALAEVIAPHFDASFYRRNNPDVVEAGVEPLQHFLRYGWREGRDPNASFSVSQYLERNRDVRSAGINPFWHYLIGETTQRRSDHSGDAATGRKADLDLSERILHEAETIRDLFDPSYYLQQNSDIAQAKVDPLLHFCRTGWIEGRDPSASFSVSYYLDENPDVRNAGINPFWHYIVVGKDEGRSARDPSADGTQDDGADDRRLREEAAVIAASFDAEYYLRHNSDVAESGIDPLYHFVRFGWHDGRDPSAAFSVSYYLESNPDVREANLNPFWHYVVAGKAEGRAPRHPGGYRAEALIATQPLEERVRAWGTRDEPGSLMRADDLFDLIAGARPRGIGKLVISVGHDNYRQVPGGVQYCIQHEEEIAAEHGFTYLNLYPHQPLPRLAHHSESPDVPVGLLLQGEALGAAAMSAVISAIRMLSETGSVEVVIHSLLGHSPEQIAELVQATGKASCYFWAHDFFALCPNYVLQRNNVSFCGAPPSTSNACRLCLYGAERVDHLARMTAFFDRLEVHVLAPSQFAADFWSTYGGPSAASLSVLPHAEIDWQAVERAPEEERKISVAFVGYPAPHKGWPAFEHIVRTFRGKESPLDFVYFGTTDIPTDAVETIPVHVTADDPDAMVRALAERQVDFVLHWASWAETFSFSTHEAIAAGAYVLTSPISGNVAATVQRLGRGAVLADEADLEAFFRDGRAQTMAAELRARRRRERGRLSRSAMTMAVLAQEAGE